MSVSLQVAALMGASGWWEGRRMKREGWSIAVVVCGGQSAMKAGI
jgi:hypothetical protein